MATLNRIVSDENYLDSERKMINGENLQIFQIEQIADDEKVKFIDILGRIDSKNDENYVASQRNMINEKHWC